MQNLQLMNVRVEPALRAAAHQAARRKGVSLSELVRRQLRSAIAEQGGERPESKHSADEQRHD